MSTLLMQLAGPLQSWGSASRFNRRSTDDAPTKSGIVGLLAAATGRRRTDRIDDIASVRLGVRVDVPGELLRDYHTAWVASETRTQLSTRFYLSDAVFLAVIEAEQEMVDALAAALAHPEYPLCLGRRSCVPARPVLLDMSDADVGTALRDTPWLAGRPARQRVRSRDIRLATVEDCEPGTPGAEVRRDVPISFDPIRREYGWRSVRRAYVRVATGAIEHDPMAPLSADQP